MAGITLKTIEAHSVSSSIWCGNLEPERRKMQQYRIGSVVKGKHYLSPYSYKQRTSTCMPGPESASKGMFQERRSRSRPSWPHLTRLSTNLLHPSALTCFRALIHLHCSISHCRAMRRGTDEHGLQHSPHYLDGEIRIGDQGAC